MGTVEKFMFDTSFDEPKASDAAGKENEAEVVEPTFTQEQLDAVRDESLAAGKQEGVKQAVGETERLAAQALQSISEQMAALTQTQEQVRADAVEGSMAIAAAIIRKIFPELERRNSLDEVYRLVENTVTRLIDETRITVHVSETLHQQVTENMQTLIVEKGYEGKLSVLKDKELAIGDCRIEWSNGRAKRDTAAAWRSIEGIIERNIGEGFLNLVESGKSSGDPADGEDNPFDYIGLDAAWQNGKTNDQTEPPRPDDAAGPKTAEDTVGIEASPEEREDKPHGAEPADQPAPAGTPPAPNGLDGGNP